MIYYYLLKIDDKSNEITAIPKLLEKLNIAGAIVTIDAMGCQRSIAEQIVAKGGDYMLSLKGNQKALHDDVKLWFDNNEYKDTAHEDIDAGHGRIESRLVKATSDM